MIFVTTGTQLPFDRLIKAMDEIAPSLNGEEIIAQNIDGNYNPVNFVCYTYIDKSEFEEHCRKARLIVSHAGIGSILTALDFGKPIIIMPRYAYLGEHRNDHQIATAMHFHDLGIVKAAYDNRQLKELILDSITYSTKSTFMPKVSIGLISSLQDYIDGIQHVLNL